VDSAVPSGLIEWRCKPGSELPAILDSPSGRETPAPASRSRRSAGSKLKLRPITLNRLPLPSSPAFARVHPNHEHLVCLLPPTLPPDTTIATASAVVGFPALLRSASPNEKLNIAVIGCGGRGGSNLAELSGENIVALCDVNERPLDAAAAKHPKARKFIDYRKLTTS